MASKRHAALLALAALGALASRGFAADPSPEEEPALPPAAVLVAGAPESDVFLRAYSFEVSATALRQRGFHVAPLQLTTSRLTAEGRDAAGCLDDATCLRAVAAELGAPTLVLVRARKDGDRWRLALQIARVEDAVSATEGAEVAGNVSEIYERVGAVLAAGLPASPPCVVQLGGPPELRLRVDDRERPLEAGRVFVAPGRHRLELRLPGRGAWRGSLRCDDGRTYRMEAR